MSKNLRKRLEEIERSLTDPQRHLDSEKLEKQREDQLLLRRYGELVTERQKLSMAEQQRLKKQEDAEILQWYVALEKAYAEQLRLHGHPKWDPPDPEEWKAYVAWVETWNLEWEKTHVTA